MIINFRYRTDGFVTKTRDTESNPGPTFVTEKAVLGSNLEYGLSALLEFNMHAICYIYIYSSRMLESSNILDILIWLQVKKVFALNTMEVKY